MVEAKLSQINVDTGILFENKNDYYSYDEFIPDVESLNIKTGYIRY
jgi:hypothetical protein